MNDAAAAAAGQEHQAAHRCRERQHDTACSLASHEGLSRPAVGHGLSDSWMLVMFVSRVALQKSAAAVQELIDVLGI